MNFQTQYNHDKDVVDQALGTYFQDDTAPYHTLLEAMRYSLTAGGKRLRPRAGARVLPRLRRGRAGRATGCMRD